MRDGRLKGEEIVIFRCGLIQIVSGLVIWARSTGWKTVFWIGCHDEVDQAQMLAKCFLPASEQVARSIPVTLTEQWTHSGEDENKPETSAWLFDSPLIRYSNSS